MTGEDAEIEAVRTKDSRGIWPQASVLLVGAVAIGLLVLMCVVVAVIGYVQR